MAENNSKEAKKQQEEVEALQERQIAESTVKRALIRHYSKKFKNLPSSERDSKIASALKKTVPFELSGKMEDGLAKMGYAIGVNQSELKGLKDIEGFIDKKSGYTLIYDSFSEGLEQVYFWILDFMRDNYWGVGLDVSKTLDDFQGSVGSSFFGDLGTRASIMQDRAMKMLTTINSVVRSVVNILYDLKEFDQRLEIYKNLKSDNEEEVKNSRLSLKQIWMDKVDMQRGRGSINMLTQQLQFVTLRDAFMSAESVEQVGDEKSGMDLNTRVKRILGPRLQEYFAWEKMSGAELIRRYKIERSYLKSQVTSLKLYSQWARPYLKAAQELAHSDYKTPDLVSTFNNMYLQASLFGKSPVSPRDIISTTLYTKSKFDNIKLEKGMHSCVEVTMQYRSIPHTAGRTETGTQYVQGGRVIMKFRGFALDQEEVDAVEKEELYEGLELVESMTTESLESMQEEIDKYLKAEAKEGVSDDPHDKLEELQEILKTVNDKKTADRIQKEIKELEKQLKPKQKFAPFETLAKGLDEITEPIRGLFKQDPQQSKVAEMTRNVAKGKAAGSAYVLYLVYKKAHGMVTE